MDSLFFLRNADTGIADDDVRKTIPGFDIHQNTSPFWREFERIIQEIIEGLLQANAVGVHWSGEVNGG